MKANKALKRLAKIEASMSAVTERYSGSAPGMREALDDAKAAVARARAVVNSQATSRTAKTSKAPAKAKPEPAKRKRKLSAAGRKAIQESVRRRWAQKKAATAKADPAAKKTASARNKTAVKKAAAIAPGVGTGKKSAPIKKTAKKIAAKRVARPPVRTPVPVEETMAPVPAATESAAQESRPAEPVPFVAGASGASSNS